MSVSVEARQAIADFAARPHDAQRCSHAASP